jgi:hypothetical protein
MTMKIPVDEFFHYMQRDGIKFFREDALAYDMPEVLRDVALKWALATQDLEVQIALYALSNSIQWRTDELYSGVREVPSDL